ncbi:MAG: prohibitin family protein, partial [Sulfurimonadaceae bacterium]|nr:prohibitin family protein [Sulfurimonadaceae bacterium]
SGHLQHIKSFFIDCDNDTLLIKIEADAQAQANNIISKSLTTKLLQLEQIQVQGKFNDALKENKDAKIFLTPGGSTPNIWVDMKNPQKQSAIQ